jgi:hypothetical protein
MEGSAPSLDALTAYKVNAVWVWVVYPWAPDAVMRTASEETRRSLFLFIDLSNQ